MAADGREHGMWWQGTMLAALGVIVGLACGTAEPTPAEQTATAINRPPPTTMTPDATVVSLQASRTASIQQQAATRTALAALPTFTPRPLPTRSETGLPRLLPTAP
jgi:hypothetical protein